MKRIAAALTALAILLCLSPASFAEEALSRPGMGQIVYVAAGGEGGGYTAEFFLAALDSLTREGDDMCIYFANARIVLKDFFTTRERNRRGVSFAGGETVTAADFDDAGQFTGVYSRGLTAQKPERTPVRGEEGDAAGVITLTRSRGGTVISMGGQAVYGALRASAMSMAEDYLAHGGDDWSVNESVSFELEPDGEAVRAVKETLTALNGLTVVNLRPQTVYLPDSAALVPIGAGRAVISFKNSLGEQLQKLSVRVIEGTDGSLTAECICPACGSDQGCTLHMLACGHYSCGADYDAAAHAVAECGIAGHCVTDGGEHGVCENCLKPLCTGSGHGAGVCEHVHKWVQQSYTAATADTAGQTVSRCSTCGIVYEQTLPATGG